MLGFVADYLTIFQCIKITESENEGHCNAIVYQFTEKHNIKTKLDFKLIYNFGPTKYLLFNCLIFWL